MSLQKWSTPNTRPSELGRKNPSTDSIIHVRSKLRCYKGTTSPDGLNTSKDDSRGQAPLPTDTTAVAHCLGLRIIREKKEEGEKSWFPFSLNLKWHTQSPNMWLRLSASRRERINTFPSFGWEHGLKLKLCSVIGKGSYICTQMIIYPVQINICCAIASNKTPLPKMG